ncbi:MAG: hypothetical protein JWL82_466 [Parcubacteria group bacterium]|nr:hypothetical protein [Parcubacteria group bacterium]
MKRFFATCGALLAGQSLLRIRMNEALRSYRLSGRTLDVGGGHAPDYFSYFEQTPATSIEMIDGSERRIDFETDALPYENSTIDTVILCNVLEHIYNYSFLLGEVRRILAGDGTLIGFVPFWTGYHPDPHDYFRYTHEALVRMLADAGFSDVTVTPITVGPLLANFNTIVLSVPRIVRPLLYALYSLGNSLFVGLRPGSVSRQPLGYVFTGVAHA